ncbi:MAG: 50S ribosomal protein L10 [Planctomycetes bacterium HGW-Planctomycetes-1]|nr:MAG: 50S ribosomal protein L10 [Planctomycetes bacterium HGW-Planctomycetes-1]
MSKSVKQLLTKELSEKFNGVSEFLVVDMTGFDGISNNLLRGELRNKGIKLTMVRNAMMRQALKTLDKEKASGLFETGCCTVAYGSDSVIDVAKEIEALTKQKPLKFTGAYIDGTVLSEAEAQNLAKMKNRVELIGEVVMLANSPARRLASAIGAPAGIIAGCIKTLADKEAA